MRAFKLVSREKREGGYTLMEYCVGAVVLMGILVTAIQSFGTSVTTAFTNLGAFLTNSVAQLPTSVKPK